MPVRPSPGPEITPGGTPDPFLQRILEVTPDVVYVYDVRKGQTVFSNRSIGDRLGYAPVELVEMGDEMLARLIHPQDLERAATALQEAAALPDGEVARVVYRVVHRSGEVRWFESRNTPFQRDAEGSTRTILGIATDITDRKGAEEALEVRENQFRLLAENAREMVCLHDPDGRYRYVSPAAVEVTGWTPEELVDQNPYDFFHPEDVERIVETSHAPAQNGNEPDHSIRFRFRHKGGHFIWLETTTRTITDDAGIVTGLQTASRDVSEQVRLEALVRRGEVMEGVGRLAAGTAHQFNNLLTVVRGNVDLLLTEALEGDGPTEALFEIQAAARTAASLVDKLLAFGGRRARPDQVVDLTHEVRTGAEMLRPMLRPEHTLHLRVPDEPLSAWADASTIRQILVNLLMNAREALPEDGGSVTVELAPVRLDAPLPHPFGTLEPGPYAVLEVTDTGRGMGEDVLPLIFEPFFTTKSDGVGTGMGLSEVRGSVDQLDGAIVVESRPGEGTRVRCYLPVRREGADPPPRPEPLPGQGPTP